MEENEFLVNQEDLDNNSSSVAPQEDNYSPAPKEKEDFSHSEEENEVPVKKQPSKEKQRLNHLSRYARGLEEKLQTLEEERQQWKELYQKSNEAAAFHNEESLKLRIEAIKKARKEALLEHDVEKLSDLDTELPTLINKLDKVETWKTQEYIRKQQEEEYQKRHVEETKRLQQQQAYNMQDWVSRNSWYMPDSHVHNPQLKQEVTRFAQALENELISTGRSNAIGSPEYYQEVDNFVSEFQRNRPQNPRQETNRDNQSAYVGNVRNGSLNQPSPSRKYIPTSEDKEWIARLKSFGVSEESYLKSKVEAERNWKERAKTSNERYQR